MLYFRTTALCAAAIMAALALAWHTSPALADGGASVRSQAYAPAPTDSGAIIQARALRILRAITGRHSNKWGRYWQARQDCDAATAQNGDGSPQYRALLALTGTLCAQLHDLFDVHPAAHSPPGADRTVGLLLNEPGAALGYTLFTGSRNSDVFLIDPLGRVAHAWHMDAPLTHAKLLDNGNLLADVRNIAIEFDPRGNIIWQYDIGGRIHHDFLKMPNGNVLLIAQRSKTREQAIAAGANPEFVSEDINYDYLLEVRPTGASGGEVVWEWSPWDHLVQDFDPSKPNYGAIAQHPELIDLNFLLEPLKTTSEPGPYSPPATLKNWLHINAIDYNPALDQIMLSPRHFSELWIIDHSATTQEARGGAGGNAGMGGDLLYRWGNPRAYGHGDADDQRLFWQHQAHWIPPGIPGAGNILMFNNGWEFPGNERFYSSVDEIVPPADDYRYRRADDAAYPPDALAWTYASEPPLDFYAPFLSGTQRLSNGNTLIVDGVAGTIFQATPDGRIVWKYVLPLHRSAHLRQGERPSAMRKFQTPHGDPVTLLTNNLYRAYWYPPNYPGLQALDLTPGAYIEDTYDRTYATLAAAAAGDFGDPLANSDFDIYLDDAVEDNRRLIYIKQPCAPEDARVKFFLHIIPAHARDLPAHRQEHEFDNMDFDYTSGAVQARDDWCIAIRKLPDYPIQRIRTGQFTPAGQLWRADITLNE